MTARSPSHTFRAGSRGCNPGLSLLLLKHPSASDQLRARSSVSVVSLAKALQRLASVSQLRRLTGVVVVVGSDLLHRCNPRVSP